MNMIRDSIDFKNSFTLRAPIHNIPLMSPPRLRPFASSAPDRYSRLLPPDRETAQAATDSRLECLALSMREKPMGPPPLNGVPAGYTYFGQFIDHDLTYDPAALPEDGIETKPDETVNFRRSGLNLENMYGDGPGSRDSKLYDEDNASFRLGVAYGDCASGDRPVFDVPLDEVCLDPSSRRALAADPRNLENALVRQVHAMFLKLHNIAVTEVSERFSAHDRFTKARQRVCHQYQWLVRHDFLSRLCNLEVYRGVVKRANPLVDWGHRFSIPVEFSQAAFRFGHSMIRSHYTLGGDIVSLATLFGGKDATGPLLCEHTINWTDFLFPEGAGDIGTINPEIAMRIDTSVIPELFKIPEYSLKAFVQVKRTTDTFALPLRTLKRGVAAQLPSGQNAQRALHARAISGNNDAWKDLKQCGLAENTPLWYYILLEAEVSEGGLRLGPVGSRLIAEVIEGSLWANPESFLRQHGRRWSPEPWLLSNKKWPIRCLHDVAVVVGLADPVD